ncbi:PrsW family intramembrane metalloprotease [Mumia sp. DW29H23]|uniref:PrsW family intramembrane metalloprotease n=1 Tax=Mumia sp. DW29H23 TaxID=3421241 RepID=UPI003D69E7FE
MSTESTVTVSDADLLEARRRAIAESGWSADVRVFQPRNLAFWVWAGLVAWGVFLQLRGWSTIVSIFGPVLTLGLVVFGLYALLFWWFTQHIDRYSAIPARLYVVAFLWGAFAATWVMAAPANDALLSLYGKLFGQDFAIDWGASLAAPFTEEISKGLGLVLVITLAPRVVRTAFDGFIIGAFIGLGFQILENVSYVINSAPSHFGADPVGAASGTFLMRMAAGFASHTLYSAVFCAGLVYLLGRPSEPRRVGRGLGLMLVAMAIHFVWDSVTAITGVIAGSGTDAQGQLTIALLFGVPILAIVIVVRVFAMTVKPERRFMRDLMAPEVSSGIITAAELDALAGNGRARRRFRRSGHGLHERRRNKHLLEAGFDLAEELGHAGGENTQRVDFARSEVLRIRQG